MTKRSVVSAQQNIWYDSQNVDNTDLTLEQNFNNTIETSIINNQVGPGVLLESLIPNIIFNSDLITGFLDGYAVKVQNQPSDNNLGNQLEISLSHSSATNRRTVKICIIGLDFQDNLQFETFYFKTNETQITNKHYTSVLLLLFNDLIGDPFLSLNLGGTVLITEAVSLSLSRDPIMVAQDQQPNLFFRDFFVDGSASLEALLQNALPFYNISSLNIFTTSPISPSVIALSAGDVTTEVGEKFLANTNNIQKVTFLLSVQNLNPGDQNDLMWAGDLTCTIYPLQSTIACNGDFPPYLPIDFSPSNIPLAEVSLNYQDLANVGVVLDSTPQPVDFIFSNSPISGGNVIVPGNYYAVTLSRAGMATICDILITVGSNIIDNSRVTIFSPTGALWVDIPAEQLWFKIWHDAAKITDGQAYDSGNGITIPKTIQDSVTLITTDFLEGPLQFTGNDVFSAIIAATTDKTTPIPDQRTGNPVLTRQQLVPTVTLLGSIDVTNLENASEPLITGVIADKNVKYTSSNSLNSLINSNLYSSTMVGNELFIRIIDDPTDASRYDTSVTGLQSDLLLGNFIGAQIIPDANSPNIVYTIADAKLCTYILGDVDGNGIIDSNDLTLLNSYLGYNLTLGLPLNTLFASNNINTYVTNGYTTEIVSFTNGFNIPWQLVNPTDGYVVADGYDGVLVPDPSNIRQANFTSASVIFNNIVGLSSYNLVMFSAGMVHVPASNNGSFTIVGIDLTLDVLTVSKVYLTGDVIGQMLRADIDGDFHITLSDGYLLSSYIDCFPNLVLPPAEATTYPAPTTNPYSKIGTPFNVIRLKLEQLPKAYNPSVPNPNRNDDYAYNPTLRATTIHELPDIFINDGYFVQHNFLNFPIPIIITKELTWDESLLVTNSNPQLVPTIFSSAGNNNLFTPNSCHINGINCNVYGSKPNFTPGQVNVFVPDNLIIGTGDLQRPNGDFYKVDFEVGTVVLEIPDGLFGSERTLDIIGNFISSTIVNGIPTGVTKLGFPAMRFADCSLVLQDALANDQLRFSVSVQSFSPNTNGLSADGYYGAIVDGKIGVAVDYTTGLLTLNFTNLYQDAVLQTLSTKIQVNVFLKKGGFNNQALFVNSSQVQNMLQLISVFSGANVGGPSALVNLSTDILPESILPLANGGSGANGVGSVPTAAGYVLMSNGINGSLGYQVSYQLLSSNYVGYTPTNPTYWNLITPPVTVQQALDRIAAWVHTNFPGDHL